MLRQDGKQRDTANESTSQPSFPWLALLQSHPCPSHLHFRRSRHHLYSLCMYAKQSADICNEVFQSELIERVLDQRHKTCNKEGSILEVVLIYERRLGAEVRVGVASPLIS